MKACKRSTEDVELSLRSMTLSNFVNRHMVSAAALSHHQKKTSAFMLDSGESNLKVVFSIKDARQTASDADAPPLMIVQFLCLIAWVPISATPCVLISSFAAHHARY